MKNFLLLLVIPFLFSCTSKKLEPTEDDKLIFKKIFMECMSVEKISKETHEKFWNLVEKYKLNQEEVEGMRNVFSNGDILLLQQYFWNDALTTIETNQIYESEARVKLEQKILNNDQKKRNKDLLIKIHNKKPININGEQVIINNQSCKEMIKNLEEIFLVLQKNINLLMNKDSLKK